MFSNTLQTKIIYAICIIFLLYTIKPSILFKQNGKIRSYGVGYDEEGHKRTLYTFQFVIIIIVLLISLLMKN